MGDDRLLYLCIVDKKKRLRFEAFSYALELKLVHSFTF